MGLGGPLQSLFVSLSGGGELLFAGPVGSTDIPQHVVHKGTPFVSLGCHFGSPEAIDELLKARLKHRWCPRYFGHPSVCLCSYSQLCPLNSTAALHDRARGAVWLAAAALKSPLWPPSVDSDSTHMSWMKQKHDRNKKFFILWPCATFSMLNFFFVRASLQNENELIFRLKIRHIISRNDNMSTFFFCQLLYFLKSSWV